MLDAFDEQISDELRDWIKDLLNDRVGEDVCHWLIYDWVKERHVCACLYSTLCILKANLRWKTSQIWFTLVVSDKKKTFEEVKQTKCTNQVI